jgi:hypothetical protein
MTQQPKPFREPREEIGAALKKHWVTIAVIFALLFSVIAMMSGGARGPQGIQGIQGADGAIGSSGAAMQGPRGEQGLIGEKGADGAQGIKGDKGDEGPPGASGVMRSITTDVITVFRSQSLTLYGSSFESPVIQVYLHYPNAGWTLLGVATPIDGMFTLTIVIPAGVSKGSAEIVAEAASSPTAIGNIQASFPIVIN